MQQWFESISQFLLRCKNSNIVRLNLVPRVSHLPAPWSETWSETLGTRLAVFIACNHFFITFCFVLFLLDIVY